MNKNIGIALVVASVYFIVDMFFLSASHKLFTLHDAVMYLLHACYYVFSGYAGMRLIASGGNGK